MGLRQRILSNENGESVEVSEQSGIVTQPGVGKREVQTGDKYQATSKVMQISDSLVVKWENPVGSGVRTAVDSVIAYNSSEAVQVDLQKNPSYDPPDSAIRANENAKAELGGSAATVYVEDTTNSLNGSATDLTLLSNADSTPTDVDLDLPPGASVGVEHNTGSLSELEDVWFVLSWVEYPA